MRIIEIENLNVKKATIKESKALLRRKRGYSRGNCASRGNTKGKEREKLKLLLKTCQF
jgi:hypothetical protein